MGLLELAVGWLPLRLGLIAKIGLLNFLCINFTRENQFQAPKIIFATSGGQ